MDRPIVSEYLSKAMPSDEDVHMQLLAMSIHPIKSCAGIAVDAARVEPRGLAGDRRWMLVDAQGRFVTGRQYPVLVRVQPQPQPDGSLRLHAPGQPELTLRPPGVEAERIAARLWDDRVELRAADDSASDWFSTLLGIRCRLAFQAEDSIRAVDPDYGAAGDQVSLADGYPLLLIHRPSLDALGAQIGRAMDARRFRPNLLIDGGEAWAEDRWRRLAIGECVFDLVKPCARCTFTTIDPDSGERSRDGEPLRTLARTRRGANGVLFGMNLIPRRSGWLRVGDRVRVLAAGGAAQ